MIDTNQPTVVSAISNAGGEAKTAIAVALEAGFALMERPVNLVCVDQGMGSLMIQRAPAASLGWGEPPERAPEIFEKLRGRDVIFDFGANTFASGSPVIRTYYEVNRLLLADGYNAVKLVPVSTNKPGAVGAAKMLAEQLTGEHTYIVRVNRDGSGRFDEPIDGPNVIEMPHMATWLQEFRDMLHNSGSTMAAALRRPPPGLGYGHRPPGNLDSRFPHPVGAQAGHRWRYRARTRPAWARHASHLRDQQRVAC